MIALCRNNIICSLTACRLTGWSVALIFYEVRIFQWEHVVLPEVCKTFQAAQEPTQRGKISTINNGNNQHL